MKGKLAGIARGLGISIIVALAAAIAVPSHGAADEVDEILAKRIKNRDRVKKFSAEISVETQQPKNLKNPKKVKMRYKMKLEKLPPAARKNSNNPWLMETEVLEPLPMKMKVEGDQAWFMDQHGQWVELPMTPDIKEQFFGMSERFFGADPKKQREKFDIKIVRRNNPVFGPRTKTLEFKPKGKSKMFHRIEEDINNDGLAIKSRNYDENGKKIQEIIVKRHSSIDGVPIVELLEATAETANGEIISITNCYGHSLEIKESDTWR